MTLIGKQRFNAVDNGSIDLLARNTTWTMLRDSSYEIDYAGINFFDGQGFIVKNFSGINSVYDLEGKKICVQDDSRIHSNIQNYFSILQINIEIDNASTNDQWQQYTHSYRQVVYYLLGRLNYMSRNLLVLQIHIF